MDFNDLQHPIVYAIYKTYEEADREEPRRGYLGASIIGAKCERYLWYTFRDCCENRFDGRMLRLFDRGDCEEIRMVKDLRAIGCTVYDYQQPPADSTPGYPVEEPYWAQQWEISALGDHFSGHLDAIIRGIGDDLTEQYVAEFKTHNKRSFGKLKELKVKRAQPKHYAQMQVYMYHLGLKKALYLAINKDDEELYAEIVEYNHDESEELMLKAKRIILAWQPPPRVSEKRTVFECTYCSANNICWGNPNLTKPEDALPRKSCCQCKHAKPDINRPGRYWVCGETRFIPHPSLPCEHYEIIPGLLPEVKK